MSGQSNNKIDKIIMEFVFNKRNDKSLITMILNYCNKLQKSILKSTDKSSIKLLFEFVYIINYLYKAAGLLQIISPSKNTTKIDTVISQYYTDFLKNVTMLSHIKKIKLDITNKTDLSLVEKILENMLKKQDVDINRFTSNINNIKQEISNTLNDVQNMNTNEIKKYIPDVPKKIILDRQSYFYLQRKIKDPILRTKIEVEYFKKSKKCLNLLEKLIIERHKYAMYMKHNTYFEFIKQKSSGESKDITSLINDLIGKIDTRSRKEMERIRRELSKDGCDKKVDLSDIIFYYEKLKTKHAFSSELVTNVIFDRMKKYFGIQFIKNTEHYDICNYSYNVINSAGEIIGVLYIVNNLKQTCPISLHLCQQYDATPSKMTLLMGNNKNMTYSDVIYLFREFGTILQTMSCTTLKNGVLFGNNEFDTLFSQIMEYIAWEKETISKICFGLDKTVIDHILFMRYIDFANSIKLRCITALFDHIIHNSHDLIETIISDNANSNPNLLETLYKKLYKDVMNSQQDIFNTDIVGINPTIIYQEINGSEGMIYNGILTEMLSFGIYNIIKNGNGIEFFNKTLNVEPTKIKKSMHEFISMHNTDSYDLYLQEIVGYNEIDTEANIRENEKLKTTNCIITDSSVNHFGEDSDSNSENDSDDIIHIDKKFEF